MPLFSLHSEDGVSCPFFQSSDIISPLASLRFCLLRTAPNRHTCTRQDSASTQGGQEAVLLNTFNNNQTAPFRPRLHTTSLRDYRSCSKTMLPKCGRLDTTAFIVLRSPSSFSGYQVQRRAGAWELWDQQKRDNTSTAVLLLLRLDFFPACAGTHSFPPSADSLVLPFDPSPNFLHGRRALVLRYGEGKTGGALSLRYLVHFADLCYSSAY